VRALAFAFGVWGVAALVGCLAEPASDGAADAPATQCELCHADVELVFTSTKHAAAGHKCQTCHGRSARHSWSEDGSVAPTRPLKTRAEVDALCNSCHKDHKHKLPVPLTRRCSACHDPHPKKEDKQAHAA
jgi:formate-dependent nitrite reductase cytochrome c552 subunit